MSQWKFETDPSAFFVGHVVDEKGQSIANVAKGSVEHGHMLAASPIMLQALLSAECAVRELCEGQHPDNQCWDTLREVRSAIRAADADALRTMNEDIVVRWTIGNVAEKRLTFIFKTEDVAKRALSDMRKDPAIIKLGDKVNEMVKLEPITEPMFNALVADPETARIRDALPDSFVYTNLDDLLRVSPKGAL